MQTIAILQSIAKKNQHSLPIQTPESYKVISLATSIIHPVISAFNNAVTSSSKHYVVTLPLNLLSFRCLQSYQVFSYAQIYHFFSAARSHKKKKTSAETGNYIDCPNKMHCYYRRTRSVCNPLSTYLWVDVVSA